MARILREIPVRGLFADVVLLVVAMALGGVERNGGRAAGALVALLVLGNGWEGPVQRLCHCWSPLVRESTRGARGSFGNSVIAGTQINPTAVLAKARTHYPKQMLL